MKKRGFDPCLNSWSQDHEREKKMRMNASPPNSLPLFPSFSFFLFFSLRKRKKHLPTFFLLVCISFSNQEDEYFGRGEAEEREKEERKRGKGGEKTNGKISIRHQQAWRQKKKKVLFLPPLLSVLLHQPVNVKGRFRTCSTGISKQVVREK